MKVIYLYVGGIQLQRMNITNSIRVQISDKVESSEDNVVANLHIFVSTGRVRPSWHISVYLCVHFVEYWDAGAG